MADNQTKPETPVETPVAKVEEVAKAQVAEAKSSEDKFVALVKLLAEHGIHFKG